MRDGLNATNRSIFFSLCGWETWYAPEGAKLANSWRIGPDDGNWRNIVKNIDLMSQVAQYAGPDKGWNDPCLLVSADWTGKHLITELQTRAQFSMWSVMAVRAVLLFTIVCSPEQQLLCAVSHSRRLLCQHGVTGSATDFGDDPQDDQLHARDVPQS